MTENTVETILQEIGLNKKESLCYAALLELGSSKTGIITKKTAIPSSKIYEILAKLISKGFVTYIIKNNIKYYQASNPKVLINLLNQKKKRVEEMLPQLLLKQQFSKRQSVQLYEGQKAVFSLFTNLIEDARPKELYLIFSINEENKNKSANLFFKNISVRRKEKKLDIRLFKNVKYHDKHIHKNLKIKYTKFNLPQGLTVFRDNVILLSWRDEAK